MTIKVKSNLDGTRVALWERHPDHPDGEVFIAGDRVVEVAETTAVRDRLKQDILVKVETRRRSKPKAKNAPKAESEPESGDKPKAEDEPEAESK